MSRRSRLNRRLLKPDKEERSEAGSRPRTSERHPVDAWRAAGNLAVQRSILAERNQPTPSSAGSVAAAPGGGGRPLDRGRKETLERGFGAPLDGVTVHDDHGAHRFVRERGAYAVTVGQDIYLGSPAARTDNRLLAHEVAHTLQQRNAPIGGHGPDVERYQALERDADRAADRALRGQSAAVGRSPARNIEQAQGEEGQPDPQVRSTEMVVVLTGVMTDEQRAVLMSHPPTYRSVVRRLIAHDADWITDKLLEVWVDDDDEWAIVRRIRRWAYTPKIEGGNYLDEILDAIRRYSYSFDYLVSESASGNMLDKLFSELEDERYSAFTALVDTFSVRYSGYRGRGGIGRWSGIQTAVMPSEVRDRLSRINQRLAGRVTLPMTPAEVRKINGLYAQLRSKDVGPDRHAGPRARAGAGTAGCPGTRSPGGGCCGHRVRVDHGDPRHHRPHLDLRHPGRARAHSGSHRLQPGAVA